MEIRGDLLAMSMGNTSANVSGTAPNLTTLIGTPAEIYKQVKITGPGPNGGTRTATFWRCVVRLDGELPIAKGDSQVMPLTITALYDSSVSTADKICKIVDAGGT